jgi:hypothetical protein
MMPHGLHPTEPVTARYQNTPNTFRAEADAPQPAPADTIPAGYRSVTDPAADQSTADTVRGDRTAKDGGLRERTTLRWRARGQPRSERNRPDRPSSGAST